MLRSSLFSASAFALLCVTASAQDTLTPKRITSPVKDRGTYHVATGTWSRANAADSVGTSDVLFNNTAPSGYFFGSSSALWDAVEEGRIPSTTSIPIVGNANAYEIDGYQIAYCTNAVAGSPFSQATVFFECYVPCSDVDSPMANPVAGFLATGLPVGTATGGQGCWIVTFDLSNTTITFNLNGDCDGTWDNDANTDSFGWLGSYPQTTPANGTGPIISGNCAGGGGMSSPPQGFGTKFAGVPGATDATGLGTSDFFWIDDNSGIITPNANGGCFFFGGCNNMTGPGANPWAGFWMQMFGTKKTGIGTPYCSSLVNASGGAAILSTGGTDANVDLTLSSTPVPNTIGQFFYGPMMLGGTTSLGDGLRCVGGATQRMSPFITAGMMAQPANTANFTVNYTQPYAAGLTGLKHFQHWFRSGVGTGTGSNSSTAVSVQF